MIFDLAWPGGSSENRQRAVGLLQSVDINLWQEESERVRAIHHTPLVDVVVYADWITRMWNNGIVFGLLGAKYVGISS